MTMADNSINSIISIISISITNVSINSTDTEVTYQCTALSHRHRDTLADICWFSGALVCCFASPVFAQTHTHTHTHFEPLQQTPTTLTFSFHLANHLADAITNVIFTIQHITRSGHPALVRRKSSETDRHSIALSLSLSFSLSSMQHLNSIYHHPGHHFYCFMG